MQDFKKIDYELLTKPTGDPFSEVGGYVIKFLSEQYPEKDIISLIKHVSNIYIDRWNAGLHMFFLNSTITQSAKGYQTPKEKKEKTEKYFTDLLQGIINGINGTCRITGKETILYKAGRENSFLTGSGAFLNFHHGLDTGIMLSKEAIIKFFFVPYGTEIIYDKIGVIGSNIPEIVEYYVNKVVERNNYNSLFKFTQRSKYTTIANALFGFTDDLITNLNVVIETKKDISLTLYHFTNFSTSPTIDIHTIPSKVFHFYYQCQATRLQQDWNKFIKANYIKYKGHQSKYDQSSNSYVEQVNELYGIEENELEKLRNDKSLNFDLYSFNCQIDSKTLKNYILFDVGEYDHWKTGKIFKNWKEHNPDKANKLKEKCKKFKEVKTLQYHENYYSYKWINIIYNKLIQGESIISNILKWSKKNEFNFKIVRYYQEIVKNMNTKTLDLIEKLSDYIIMNESDIKSNISKLRTNNASFLRSFFIRLIEKNYKDCSKEPLVTLREYVEFLFPSGIYWKEIRDLMLICVFQKLHEQQKFIEDFENNEVDDFERDIEDGNTDY